MEAPSVTHAVTRFIRLMVCLSFNRAECSSTTKTTNWQITSFPSESRKILFERWMMRLPSFLSASSRFSLSALAEPFPSASRMRKSSMIASGKYAKPALSLSMGILVVLGRHARPYRGDQVLELVLARHVGLAGQLRHPRRPARVRLPLPRGSDVLNPLHTFLPSVSPNEFSFDKTHEGGRLIFVPGP
jgi:hypothetical protein